MVNYVIIATGMFMLGFYIFRRKTLYDDYIQQWIPKTCMAMQIKAWMANFLFQKIMCYFKRSILGGISLDQTLIKINIMAWFRTT